METNRIEQIKELRRVTGLGLKEILSAMQEVDFNFEKAKSLLLDLNFMRGCPICEGKQLKAGKIVSYIHNERIGALVEIRCETDFCANSLEFNGLCKLVAQQVVGTKPEDLNALLAEPWIRDPHRTIKDLVEERARQLNEVIEIKRFVRFALPT